MNRQQLRQILRIRGANGIPATKDYISYTADPYPAKSLSESTSLKHCNRFHELCILSILQ
jgi:hypothetical protein